MGWVPSDSDLDVPGNKLQKPCHNHPLGDGVGSVGGRQARIKPIQTDGCVQFYFLTVPDTVPDNFFHENDWSLSPRNLRAFIHYFH